MTQHLCLNRVFVIALIAGLAAPSAFAQNATETHQEVIIKMTGDRQYITPEDAKGPLKDHFTEIDTNKDGKLTPDEIKAWFMAHPPQHGAGHGCHMMIMHDGHGPGMGPDGMGPPPHHMDLMSLDTDHDGRVSWAEFQVGLKAHFDKMDKNHDGFITKDEMPPPPMMMKREVRIDRRLGSDGKVEETMTSNGPDDKMGCPPMPPEPPAPPAPPAPPK